MNYTQNKKIEQVKETTLVVGIDVGSETHYARAFDWRGIEYSKKAFSFANSEAGYHSFMAWMHHIREEQGKIEIICGFEPTGHYWFNLGQYLADNEITYVMVNPAHVKKTKELDDNSPAKNDRKDPKTIAQLVKDGKYSYVYVPEGSYAELRVLSNLRLELEEDQIRVKNKIARWLSIYFPEYKTVFKDVYGVGSLMVLKETAIPKEIIELGAEKINQIWRNAKIKAVGINRAKSLVEAAIHSIGKREGLEAAKLEILYLIEEYERKRGQVEEVLEAIEVICKELPGYEELLKIKGFGVKTVSLILSEIGDVTRFENAKQVQKYAGLEIASRTDSGKHHGYGRISRRGRKRLRTGLFQLALSLIAKNKEFREIYHYYLRRKENSLKKMQALIAVACKALRIIFAVSTKGLVYNPEKMLQDIRRPEQMAA